ncbi:MAG: o-succinylbenzoate synthase [Deltaproteobacteria bacterium]|nr:o-succinylbenzoate synthase [Deltaproteobacteria bacterium]
MKLEVEAFSLTLKRPLRTARGELARREGWRVALRTAKTIGRGEAMPWPAFGTETPEAAEQALRSFELSKVTGSVEEVREAIAGLGQTPAARFAVEAALLEHLARSRELSVARLLGESIPAFAAASTPSQVRTGTLLDSEAPEKLAAEAASAVGAGFRTLKVKVAARAPSDDEARLRAVREAVGKDVRLRIDANGGWTEEQAREALRRLGSVALELCEQPVPALAFEALRRLRGQVPCAIAADEALLQAGAAESLLAGSHPAVDVVVLKPVALGGLLVALDLAQRARAVGVAAFVTTMLDGPIATAAAAHLAALLDSSDGCGPAHGLATGALFVESASHPSLRVEGGRVAIPDVPGWGVT